MRALALVVAVVAAAAAGDAEEIPLWEGAPPHSKPSTVEERIIESWGVPCVTDVTRPTITIHPAQGENSGRAVIVIPGGGYEVEAFEHEGRVIAAHLAAEGVTSSVLKYRLPQAEISDTPWLLPLTDARRAVALMRRLATTYGFDADKVGVVGFSAGGHLAASASVMPAEEPAGIPDFAVLVYPAVAPSEANREWLSTTFFHHPMTDAEIEDWNLIRRIGESTPPMMLVHAYDDEMVPISESLDWAEAMTAADRPVELHLFPAGGHGFGPGRTEDGSNQWLGLLVNWVRRQGTDE